nr:hypothetical protein Iba_chr08cCG6740 [Ipomoea batatas]
MVEALNHLAKQERGLKVLLNGLRINLQMEIPNVLGKGAALLKNIPLQDAIAPHLQNANLIGPIMVEGTFKEIVIGIQATETILIALHQDAIEVLQKGGVRLDTDTGVEVGVYLAALMIPPQAKSTTGPLHAAVALWIGGQQLVIS